MFDISVIILMLVTLLWITLLIENSINQRHCLKVFSSQHADVTLWFAEHQLRATYLNSAGAILIRVVEHGFDNKGGSVIIE